MLNMMIYCAHSKWWFSIAMSNDQRVNSLRFYILCMFFAVSRAHWNPESLLAGIEQLSTFQIPRNGGLICPFSESNVWQSRPMSTLPISIEKGSNQVTYPIETIASARDLGYLGAFCMDFWWQTSTWSHRISTEAYFWCFFCPFFF